MNDQNPSQPKELIDQIEDMLEERKSPSDRRQEDVPVETDRRSGKDRRTDEQDEG